MLRGAGSSRVLVACALLVAATAGGASCASVLGIDQPNVVGDGGADGSAADTTSGGDGPDATNDTGAPDDVVDSGADSSVVDGADSGPTGDAPFDARDASLDSSTPDTSSDSPPDAPDAATGPVACASAGVLLCDDFENGLDLTKWAQVDQNNGTTVIDTSNAHRGTHSLHMTSDAVPTGPLDISAQLEHWEVLPQTVYARFFLFLSAGLPAALPSVAVTQQNHSPFQGLQLETANAAGDLGLTDWASSPDLNLTSTAEADAGAWLCVEWQITQPLNDGGMGQMDVWLNGAEVSGLHVSSLAVPDLGFLTFGLGFFHAPAQPSYDMWIDDVFVDTSPVGCTK